VSREEGKEFFTKYRFPHVETCTKHGLNVDETFISAYYEVLRKGTPGGTVPGTYDAWNLQKFMSVLSFKSLPFEVRKLILKCCFDLNYLPLQMDLLECPQSI